jgi:hypothetical protein
MAVPDAVNDAARDQRRIPPDRLCAFLAAPAAAAAVALWTVDLLSERAPLVTGVAIGLWVVAAVLVVAWLVTAQQRRILTHLKCIEGSRYRDGYADGFIDAVNQRQPRYHDRPSLRPVK